MGSVVLIARLILAAVFAVAGIAKLLDRQGTKKSLPQFGVPDFLAAPFAILLPLAELTCAAGLLVTSWMWPAAGATAALLALFTLGIGITLARGKAPDCHCFGQMSSKPVSWRTLVRNAALLVLALVVVWKGRDTPGEWPVPSNLEAVLVAVSLAIAVGLAVTIWLLFHMLKQNGRLLLRLEAVEKKLDIDPNKVPVPGLSVGVVAPELRLASLEGRTVTSEMLATKGKPILLIFTDVVCGACDALMPEVAKWQQEFGDRLSIVPVSGGALEANRAKAKQHKLENVLLQAGRETSEAYKVTATPSAVLIADGKINSVLAEGPDAIRKLVTRSTLPPPAKKGELVPALKLADLEGESVDLAVRGRRKLVLFWNPGCGFCQAMLDDVKKWERNPPREAPEVLIISSGTVEANRQQGFRSPVLLDPDWVAGSVLGAGGTPSAVLIDENGRVASEVGVGAPAVLEMAGVAK
jgi:thiol-disulfide isomerase/thioredoxin/uncharacterized membrane protein YphA (DoxX/SURF4 family)